MEPASVTPQTTDEMQLTLRVVAREFDHCGASQHDALGDVEAQAVGRHQVTASHEHGGRGQDELALNAGDVAAGGDTAGTTNQKGAQMGAVRANAAQNTCRQHK